MARPATGQVVNRARKRATTGVRERHARNCRRDGARGCTCAPTYEAFVYSARDGRKIRKSFRTISEAKRWRADASGAVRRGVLKASSPITLREACKAWIEGVKAGTIRDRSGQPFKASTIRGYERALNGRIVPEFGTCRISDVRQVDLQDYADTLLGEGLDGSTIRNTFMPLRSVFRRAVNRGDVLVNPTRGLELPAGRGRREKVVSPEDASTYLDALADSDRAVWATALFGGLRRGELMALRWEDVDLEAGLIRVERGWDPRAGVIEPKSRAGRRTVPIAKALREHLIAHRLRSGRSTGLAFGRTAETPFHDSTILRRARDAWTTKELTPIDLHTGRHTFASLMIAAGVNAKALSSYMGHASVTITLDRYGHLFPGNEEQAANLLDDYLERATGAHTGAQSR